LLERRHSVEHLVIDHRVPSVNSERADRPCKAKTTRWPLRLLNNVPKDGRSYLSRRWRRRVKRRAMEYVVRQVIGAA
jgi:hypothetical protein